MSTWEAMVTDAITQLRNDYSLVQAAAESRTYDRARMGVSFRQGHRTAWWQAWEWLLNAQLDWPNLTEADAIEELRKGSGSIYYPLFKDDPKVWVECPSHGRTAVGAEGYCPQCGWEVK